MASLCQLLETPPQVVSAGRDSTSDIIMWKPVCEVDNCRRVLSVSGSGSSRRRVYVKKDE